MHKEYLQEAGNIFELPFYGRVEELKQLNQLMIEKRYHLITLVGMVGIGKTLLAARFTKIVQNQFQYIVIWKNLRTTASFEDFLNKLLNFLSVNTNLSATSNDKIDILINYFKDNQCLLVLDDLTEILTETSNRCKIYKQGWQNFGIFLEYAALKLHESIILITCHEHPKNFNNENIKNHIKTIEVKGLNVQDIKQKFPQLQPQNDPEYYWKKLVEYYGGNPGILNIVAQKISEQYDDDISSFIEGYDEHIYGSNSNTLEDKVKDILNKQFKNL